MTSCSATVAMSCSSISLGAPRWPPNASARSAPWSLWRSSGSPGDALTDPRELLALQHVDDSAPADGRFQHNKARAVLHHLAYHAGLSAFTMPLHRRHDPLGVGSRDDRQQLALIGDVQRVQAKQLAHAAHGLADGDRGFVEHDTDARLLRELVQG